MNLFLDDIRSPLYVKNKMGIMYPEEWVVVRNYFDFINIVEKKFDDIQLISFDHDIASYKNEKEFTGKDAVDYVINICIDNNKKFPNWFVHTDNVVGRPNMIGTILNYMKHFENNNIIWRYYNNGIIDGVII